MNKNEKKESKEKIDWFAGDNQSREEFCYKLDPKLEKVSNDSLIKEFVYRILNGKLSISRGKVKVGYIDDVSFPDNTSQNHVDYINCIGSEDKDELEIQPLELWYRRLLKIGCITVKDYEDFCERQARMITPLLWKGTYDSIGGKEFIVQREKENLEEIEKKRKHWVGDLFQGNPERIKHAKEGSAFPFKTKRGRCESVVQYCEKELGKRNDSVQDLVGYIVWQNTGKKAEMCEKCYQGAKRVQWERNKANGWIHVEWFFFYDEERQKMEDKTQLDDYYSRDDKPISKGNDKSPFKFNKILDI